ncbi:hypothetical protein E1287_36025 [Actinomadura sp. KC06]|uniref:DUF6084 family protein n=1 Tax=Actinomadura sp. KC06 TaxID=2530369 RepID=UPI001049F608|nr:DUF6084 family protein [Actinomadura sp. KC06]TDD26710.1 hypothetical protein E1287_36025 [Actinomadura sp. KC06]
MNGPPELGLEVLGVEAGTAAATPVLSLRVGLRRMDGGLVQCVLLTTTVTIKPARLSWARVGATVPTFRGGTELTLTLPCRTGVRAAAERHLHALGDGGVQLDLAFDGTVFYPGEDGAPRDGQVPRTGQAPWRHETTVLLPAETWRDLMAVPGLRDRRSEPSPRHELPPRREPSLGHEALREEEPTA